MINSTNFFSQWADSVISGESTDVFVKNVKNILFPFEIANFHVSYKCKLRTLLFAASSVTHGIKNVQLYKTTNNFSSTQTPT